MQIVIAGAGSVGRSIARELISHGHEVTLVDRSAEAMRIASVPEADWQLADACDIEALEDRLGVRVAWISRDATALLPEAATVIQEHDRLHLAVSTDRIGQVRRALSHAPTQEA